ncbi:response regulator [Kistimonas scapharcae]|uniref:Response regulator n=1 Tax=Kistimonas scapharcae TaxID=1036133 RepID=A0ABP8V636_9GAMM
MDTELKRILYVEDDPSMQKLVNLVLETGGHYQITTYKTAKEALNQLPQIDVQMILLDVMLPDMDGIQLYNHIREMNTYQSTPIAFVTAKVEKHEIETYQKTGAIGVIVKPFVPTELTKTIRELWNTHLKSTH